MHRRLIVPLVVAAGLASAGVAYAENQPSDPQVAPKPPAAAGPGRGVKAGVRKGAIHGDLLVRGDDGATRTVTFDRGRVTQISEGSITLERPDGVSVTDGLTAATVFNGTPRDQLQAGAGVIVVSDGDRATRVFSTGAGASAAAKRCAEGPVDGASGDRRRRIRDRVCQRRQDREARRGGGASGPSGPAPMRERQRGRSGADGRAPEPSATPDSLVDDGLETIVS